MNFLVVALGFVCSWAFRPGTIKSNYIMPITVTVDNTPQQLGLVLDANWRWIHTQQGGNCFGANGWESQHCSSPQSCLSNCALSGVEQGEYASTYGVRSEANGRGVSIQFVNQHAYGVSYGARTYLVQPDGSQYFPINPIGKEIAFTMDNSQIRCGMNSAVYLAQMPLDGASAAGPGFGTGYGDAQCPRDIKLINGQPNIGNRLGACSNEFDLAESNSRSWQGMTVHPCSFLGGVQGCVSDTECGIGEDRYNGLCDKDGAGWNPYQWGNKTDYGKGSQFTINTELPFRVSTEFHAGSDGALASIVQTLTQNGKSLKFALSDAVVDAMKDSFEGGTNHFAELGGMRQQGAGLANNVFIISLWDDESPAQMRWLDGVSGTGMGSERGPCISEPRSPGQLRSLFPGARSIVSDIEIKTLTKPSPVPSPTPVPTPTPVPIVPPQDDDGEECSHADLCTLKLMDCLFG